MQRNGWISLCGILALLGCSSPTPQAKPVTGSLRAATEIVANTREIVGPQGVRALETVEIGGIPQWISVRGRDRRNPLLLFLHGGPGYPMMPASYSFQAPWEEYFTVVQWDQRGAGKTYVANDPATIAPTLTPARMIADAEEMVQVLRQRYGKDKIILLGHSWGTVLGVELAKRHPGWFYAYVGVGQTVDTPESERLAYLALLDTASRAGNAQALAELRGIAPYPEANGAILSAKLKVQRKWQTFYGGYVFGKADDHYADIVKLSPDYTELELQAFGAGISFSFDRLLPQISSTSFRAVRELNCPVVLFHGRHDLTSATTLAQAWFDALRAPKKKLIWFERSAHLIFTEEPGKVFHHLVDDVLPLASEGDEASKN
jgi:pimeloyl-ACP methyl ester carboxylesterase